MGFPDLVVVGLGVGLVVVTDFGCGFLGFGGGGFGCGFGRGFGGGDFGCGFLVFWLWWWCGG